MSKSAVGCSPIKLDLLSCHVQGPHILDLGAGRLYYASWVLKHFSDVSVVAVDMLEQASRPGITYLKANLEHPLSLPPESFSTVIAFDVIEHIENERQIVSEIARVLAPNGVLIGSVPHDDDGFLPAYNVTFYHRSDITHKRYYTVASLTDLLESTGLSDVVVTPAGGVPAHIFAEFFPSFLRWPMKKLIGLCVRLGLLNNNRLKSDLFFVARKR